MRAEAMRREAQAYIDKIYAETGVRPGQMFYVERPKAYQTGGQEQ